MDTIKRLLFGVLVSLTVAATGCQGADYPGADSTATTAPADNAADTVTEHSNVMLPCDNLTGIYDYTWIPAPGDARPPVYVTSGFRLALAFVSCNFPTGKVYGNMNWFATGGALATVEWPPGGDWSRIQMIFYVTDPSQPKRYRLTCLASGVHKWNCAFDVQQSDGRFYTDGTILMY